MYLCRRQEEAYVSRSLSACRMAYNLNIAEDDPNKAPAVGVASRTFFSEISIKRAKPRKETRMVGFGQTEIQFPEIPKEAYIQNTYGMKLAEATNGECV